MCTKRGVSRSRGFTLVELIMFIVIVGAAVAGVLSVFTTTVRSSADPMIRKQMVAIAEALMSEITLHPFTYCDPDDANVLYANAAAVGAGNCAATAEGVGPEAGAGDANRTLFDNVSDYVLAEGPATTPQGAAILADYTSRINIDQVGDAFGLADDAVLQIEVRVSRGGDSVTLTGYRFRHSPNAAG